MGLRKKILIVEDNEFNRALLVEILSSQYETLEAENGKVGLEILEREKEAVSLILLDIVMPVMNGYEFLDALKANPAIASIPVIVTTQNEGENDEIAALERGASDFVAKPYRTGPPGFSARNISVSRRRKSFAPIRTKLTISSVRMWRTSS